MNRGLQILIIGILIFVGGVLLLQMGLDFLTWRAIVSFVCIFTAGYLTSKTKFV